MKKIYTKEDVKNHLKKHYLKNPKITVKSFDRDKTVCSSRTVFDNFESWNKALEEAGIGKRVRLLRLLLEHYSENRKMTYESFNKVSNISMFMIRKEFGSWNGVLIEAGIRKEGEGRITKEEIVRQLKEHYAKTKEITIKSFDKDKTVCSVNTVKSKFGSWDKALLEAKIFPREDNRREKLLEQLKDHYSRNGRITNESFDKDKMGYSTYSTRTVIREFGTWRAALEEAGLRKKKRIGFFNNS